MLFTAPGERVNRPTFGSGLLQLVFAPNSDALAAATQLAVQGALQQWLGDRIAVQDVTVEAVDSTLTVDGRLRGSPDAAVADGDLHEGGLMAVAAAQYRCGDARRRRFVRDASPATINGIDFLEVGPDQKTLEVTLLHNLPGRRTACLPRRRSGSTTSSSTAASGSPTST